ncbi:MAG: hypothetical protein KKD29_02705 [Candidatus Omnitrophica bacterium]|nr:hypothetical protein [Candidatus Omnitrophota bacterium]MBU4487823.1 hypothetical protein [Candidatus Omnitrophota bacterium]MCG2705537.1 hypothetical protein [Candidatus Omnitrophota bacterium]
MWKSKIAVSAAALLLVLGMAKEAGADRRGYVWTYEYQTMPNGHAEIEYYLTEEQKNIERAKPNTWKHWVELEYGITDHWDISMYQQFKQSNTASSNTFEYDGFKIRTRYRLFEKNKLPLDTLLYLEYIRNDNLEKHNVLEGKVILAKDMGDFNFAYNFILKQELASGGKTEHEYAAGISYSIIPQFKVGVESKGNYAGRKYYAGPTVSWSTNKFWVSLGAVAGLNKRSDDLQARLIIGIPLL